MSKTGNYLLVIALLLFLIPSVVEAKKAPPEVLLGIERLAEYKGELSDKRLGLLTNQTGVTKSLQSSVDVVREEFNLVAIFVPEHGLSGAVVAGESVADAQYEGVPVRSLYGATKRPTAEMLADIDVLLVDLQDIGVRHYTYTSSLAYAMEACAEFGKTIVVLDRPNPLGGKIEGPTLKKGYESFIGLYPLPLRHGLTIGEYAKLINQEYAIGADLLVIPLKNWRRGMYFAKTGLPWVATSPNIPTAETALPYAITGIVGDLNVSVGVGTTKPFEYVGAPWLDKKTLASELNGLGLPGVFFRPIAFEPKYGIYKDEVCQGVQVHILDSDKVQAAQTGAQLVRVLINNYSDQLAFPLRQTEGYKFDIALGESSLRYVNLSLDNILERWQRENEEFRVLSKPYLLYPW
ncbi:MAG TPA: DUF1343 domain-containing protein [Candidatus Avacidaminococcus intestinavium]|uniref:DUF1343 domain-containing protein n=1 Tax=Candidatus Avacidaminococcus intestinavium TaxID=2840684 RepID=A0A9D1MQA9_9FIRM|nr:DUF1343 domain-containing protein [Candidatus Avacidaminococcus intestinavium]